MFRVPSSMSSFILLNKKWEFRKVETSCFKTKGWHILDKFGLIFISVLSNSVLNYLISQLKRLIKKWNLPGKKVSLNDFISESTSVNTVNVDGRAVELPSAPRSSTLEIDVSKVFVIKKV